MVNICPHCGTEVDFPIVGSRTRQQIFNFIWNNPSCTRKEIEYAIYGAVQPTLSNLVNVHISMIRPVLALKGMKIVSVENRYKVIYAKPHELKVPVNANV